MTHARISRIRTERRTPIPANTTVAGENAYQIDVSVQISDRRIYPGVPGQQFQLPRRKYEERLWLDQAILSIDRCQSGTDLNPEPALEGQQEFRWDSCMFGSGRRGDVEGDRSWCVSDRLSRHLQLSVESWRMRKSLSERET